MGSGDILGDLYPASPLDSNHIVVHFGLGIRGDKTRCIRTEVFRQFPFPVFAGEKFLAESFAWNRIAMQFKMRYVNEAFAEVEYQAGGLTARGSLLRVRSPRGAYAYYKEFATTIADKHRLPLRRLVRVQANMVRYAMHSRASMAGVLLDGRRSALFIVALPLGALLWCRDRYLLERGRGGNR
jgi:hypothetical protein